jgi:hypothetical protein
VGAGACTYRLLLYLPFLFLFLRGSTPPQWPVHHWVCDVRHGLARCSP